MIFDKSSAQISDLVYKTWFSGYPCCWYLIYNNGSEFKLHFCALCNTYGIMCKPTSVKNPQANDILERIHAVFTNMVCTDKLDMAKLVKTSDIDVFLSDAAWAICSTYYTVLKASPGAAIFGWHALQHSIHADWKKHCPWKWQQDWLRLQSWSDLYRMTVYLTKQESMYLKDPWTITTVHTNGTIMVQIRNKSERMNIWRVKLFEE